MSRIQSLLLTAVLLLVCAPLSKATIVDFESLPPDHLFSGGGVSIGAYYPGLDIGTEVTGLRASGGDFDPTAFPPHSGDIVIWSPFSPDVGIAFSTEQGSAGIWYTSLEPLALFAFDSGGNELGNVAGAANTDGSFGVSSFLSYSGAGIASIRITGSPGLFVLDDLAYEPASAVPETSLALPIGLLLILLYSVRFRRGWLRRLGG